MNERIEAVVGIVFAITAAASLGIGDITLFGVYLLEPLAEVGPATLDWATAGSVVALVVGYLEIGDGNTDFDAMEPLYIYLALGTVALTAYGSYQPGFAEGQPLAIQLAVLAISVAGYWALAHN
jgi:hypothetical protein